MSEPFSSTSLAVCALNATICSFVQTLFYNNEK
jgi:hypothetical protein